MIPYEEAYRIVLAHPGDLGFETVSLEQATGRILAEPISTDRDLPPYDRATMDGIAIRYQAYSEGRREFAIQGEARAGQPGMRLVDPGASLEIMTGAVVPEGADTVIRYEDVTISDGVARVTGPVTPGQSIHPRGSDARQDTLILGSGTRIGPAEIAVLASVGKATVQVACLPVVTVLSTGDELVEVAQTPQPYQIRKSNGYALQAALAELGITPALAHLPDNPDRIREGLDHALHTSRALLLSGGVSMGKYDFLPGVLEELGVSRKFHKVAQRPGKPFWFGVHPQTGCAVFSFPGNPVSTFLNYHVYFRDWLWRSWGLEPVAHWVELADAVENPTSLTLFHLGKVSQKGAKLLARPVPTNGSGDFISLSRADGFLCLAPGPAVYPGGRRLPFVFYNRFGL